MITTTELAATPLFENADVDDIRSIAYACGDVRLRTGDWLALEGEAPAFYIVLSGALEVTKDFGRAEQQIFRIESGESIGEAALLLGTPMFVNMQAVVDTRVAKWDRLDFMELVMGSGNLASRLLETMTRRLNDLRTISVAKAKDHVIVHGVPADQACFNLRQFLSGNGITFRWRDPGIDPIMGGSTKVTGPYPAVEYADGRIVKAPTYREVAQIVGLQTAPRNKIYDVAIIGAGPAGLAAAVYGASEGLRTLMLERLAPGGQAGTSSRIENYPGFPSGISGGDLAGRMLLQAKRFGAEVVVTRMVESIDLKDGSPTILLDDGDAVSARSVILAMGVAWRTLEIDGAERLVGRGIYYGAAQTEVMAVRGRDVFLIGGGNSAGQAAVFFADYASHVTLLIRSDSISNGMSRYLIDQIESKANVSVCVNCRVVDVHGDACLDSITVESQVPGASCASRKQFETCALFAFIGADAQTEWLPSAIHRDEHGFILTGRDIARIGARKSKRDPFLLETSIPGIFAVGDVRHGSIKRVASSVGEGSMSIEYVHQFLAGAVSTTGT